VAGVTQFPQCQLAAGEVQPDLENTPLTQQLPRQGNQAIEAAGRVAIGASRSQEGTAGVVPGIWQQPALWHCGILQ
jgi:N-acetylneuraminic acid mutarotase